MVRPSADEIGLWRRAMRDVAPLPGRASRPVDPDRRHPAGNAGETPGDLTAAAAGKMPAVPSTPTPQSPALAPPLEQFAGVDRATAERVKRGRYPVSGWLDLHGMTQAEAHRALAGFVAGSRTAGRRCVLVITGHGRSSGGVLKAAVPRWLAEPELRPHVLAISTARPKDGGTGALYLLLRKPA